MFEIVRGEALGFGVGLTILRDKKTGVHYIFYKDGSAGGLTPLLDNEGKPIIKGSE